MSTVDIQKKYTPAAYAKEIAAMLAAKKLASLTAQEPLGLFKFHPSVLRAGWYAGYSTKVWAKLLYGAKYMSALNKYHVKMTGNYENIFHTDLKMDGAAEAAIALGWKYKIASPKVWRLATFGSGPKPEEARFVALTQLYARVPHYVTIHALADEQTTMPEIAWMMEQDAATFMAIARYVETSAYDGDVMLPGQREKVGTFSGPAYVADVPVLRDGVARMQSLAADGFAPSRELLGAMLAPEDSDFAPTAKMLSLRKELLHTIGIDPRLMAANVIDFSNETVQAQIDAVMQSGMWPRIRRCFSKIPKTAPDDSFAAALPALANAARNGAIAPFCHTFNDFEAWLADVSKKPARLCQDQDTNRARDTLAQRDPDWAISEYTTEYRRGKHVANVIADVLDYMLTQRKTGKALFIHGRDAEILYHVALRAKITGLRYAITSRPLTSLSGDAPDEDFMAYVQRIIPKTVNAVQIDTGLNGTIPKWFIEPGWQAEDIGLIASNHAAYKIPVDEEINVIDELEHTPQRLQIIKKWGELCYSEDAPGFWAKVYGVADRLHLPRQMGGQRPKLWGLY